jgi:hypothetical protein
MGKTILELFQTRNDKTGDVAQKKYDIRDSKERGIQTNSFLINNSAVYAINLGRRTFGVRRSETFLEEDGILGIGGVGIRPLYTLSTPVLHGTDVLRLERQQTVQTEKMKNFANGQDNNPETEGGTTGLLGSTILRTQQATKNALTKLGVSLPSDLNPTSYYQKLRIDDKSRIPTCISCIKKDGAGGILGKALAQGGTPEQIVKNAAGAAVSGIKQKARGALFGERATTGFNVSGAGSGAQKLVTINYGSSDDAISSINVGDTANDPDNRDYVNALGRRYSKTFIKREDVDLSNPNNRIKQVTDASFKSTSDSEVGFYGLANKFADVVLESKYDREPSTANGSTSYSKLTKLNKKGQTDDINANKLEVRRGMKNGSDIINQSGVYASGNTAGGEAVDVGGPKARLGWYYDFVPLKINRLNDNKTVYFRSTISGLSETFSPSWDSAKFIGNPFNYYTYTGIERSVSFNLKVYALNGREMVSMWDKLEFLSSLTYPAAYQSSTSYIIPPFIKFTLGSMYDRKEGFIESLTYTIDDTTPWETGIGILPIEPNSNYDNNFGNVGNTRSINGRPTPENIKSLDNYRLPMIVDVQMNVKFVESRNNTKDKLYAFGNPVTNG